MLRSMIVAALVCAGLASQAKADIIVVSGSLSQQTTNYTNRVLNVAQFNPTLGTLTSIAISFTASLISNFGLESLDAAPSVVTATTSGMVNLARPNDSVLINVTPSNSQTRNFSAFDGAIDFGGTSGATIPGLTAMSSGNTTLSSAADLSLFTGTGNVGFLVDATANSNGTGAGNLITQIATTAGASVQVTYTFTPAPPPARGVPAPASALLFVFGGGVMAVRRFRKA